jgi:hypothetical protein
MADLEVGGLHHMSAITRDVAERAALLVTVRAND